MENEEEKRQINSEAELVNALCKGVKVESKFKEEFYKSDMLYILENFSLMNLRYSEPVEVVELWGYYDDETYCAWVFTSEGEDDWHTHKQTQIHQNKIEVKTNSKTLTLPLKK